MNTYIKNIFNLTRWYSQFQECQGIVRKTFFIIWFILFYAIILYVFYIFFILSPNAYFNSENIVLRTIGLLTFSTGLSGLLFDPFAKLIGKLVEKGIIGDNIADWLIKIPLIPIYIYSILFVLFLINMFLNGGLNGSFILEL
tara:strand:- start:118 stop:543 length:426 start_codon:yes stop_codon:yes gene_type:complete